MSDIGWTLRLDDPLLLIAAAGLIFALLLLILLIWSVRAARRSAAAAEPLATHIGALGEAVRGLDAGQHQLAGGLKLVSEHQASTQARIMESVERRLEEVQRAMGESLHGTATRTARSLGELQQRLEAIDKAQTKIEKLSGDVLSLQDILSNKQTRGAFGEIQLNDILAKALPPDAYTLQFTLQNGKRADCLIHLPQPPGAIVIDAKFPLEPYEALHAATSDTDKRDAARAFRNTVMVHVKAIAEKYIVEEQTADSALMFLPSEAVYAELHANFGDVVRQSFEHRVWIVSPTTLMATLNTMRAILKDARMREQAGAIRRELSLLHKDVERLGERVENLDRHFGQAAKDVEQIKISATKASNRANRLEAFEFDEAEAAEERPGLGVVDGGAGVS
ncbi:MAG: DNA recombination protein RmuC [Pseudomonadota bacterium]